MHRTLLHRGLALALIGLWIAPGAGALVLGLHVAEHHRGQEGEAHHHEAHEAHRHDAHEAHRDAHDVLAQQLAAAAAHGHSHNAAAPDHDHSATGGDAPKLRLSTTAIAPAPQAHGAATRTDHNRTPTARYQPGSADPLFYAHCSLLL